jgi:hypothetical protein
MYFIWILNTNMTTVFYTLSMCNLFINNKIDDISYMIFSPLAKIVKKNVFDVYFIFF